VPNIGRNPNKPVIPGLPQVVIPEPEEGGVIQQQEDIYSAIFTREVPGGRTQWTDLEMMQRSVGSFGDWLEGTNSYRVTAVNGAMNDRKYYYWNGTTTQELFTHQSAELVDSGTVAYVGATNISTFARPGDLENGMARIDHSINSYTSIVYILVYTYTGNTPVIRFILPSGAGTTFTTLEIDSTDRFYCEFEVSQSVLDSEVPGDFRLRQVNSFRRGTITYELYRIYSDGSYFTATQSGTAFAHVTNGSAGDERTRIRYFFGAGAQPETLIQISLTQTSIDAPEFTPPYSRFDWRSPWLTATSDLINNNSQKFFRGMSSFAIQYGSLSASGGTGYFYIEPSRFTFLPYVFNGDGSGSTFTISSIVNASSFDSSTGEIESNDDVFPVDDNGLGLIWPRIDLTSFGTEGVDWFIEDICLPDVWTANSVGAYWLFPMIAIYPYTKKIFF